MRGNPRVAYRLDHGETPAWMRTAARADRERPPRREPVRVHCRTATGPRHRRPERLPGWSAAPAAYGLAALAGALVSYAVGAAAVLL
ncbi:hypothetical protein [Streptomonospora sediminis]